jgi:hypothetical protein
MQHFRTNRYDSRMNFLVNALVAAPKWSKDIFSNLHARFADASCDKNREENREPEETIEELRADEQLFRGCVDRLERGLAGEFGVGKPIERRTELDRLTVIAGELMRPTSADHSERDLDRLAGHYLNRMLCMMDPRRSLKELVG